MSLFHPTAPFPECVGKVSLGARRPVLAAKPERPLAFSKQTFAETLARRKMRR
jgi:hypothetical protein